MSKDSIEKRIQNAQEAFASYPDSVRTSCRFQGAGYVREKPTLKPHQITEEEIEESMEKTRSLIETFLLERGWEVDRDGWELWSKGNLGLLTAEEAYWAELRSMKGE